MRAYYADIPNKTGSLSPRSLIQHIVTALQTRIEGGTIQLVPSGQTYLRYVLACLQNYLQHGVTSLRGSDLREGDAIFSSVPNPILLLLGKQGLPTATVTQATIASFLAEIPTDATIYQRLARL